MSEGCCPSFNQENYVSGCLRRGAHARPSWRDSSPVRLEDLLGIVPCAGACVALAKKIPMAPSGRCTTTGSLPWAGEASIPAFWEEMPRPDGPPVGNWWASRDGGLI